MDPSLTTQRTHHLDLLLSQKSVDIINEIHSNPRVRKNLEVGQIKWPKLGSLSYLKPMIDDNRNSVIEKVNSREQGGVKLNDFQLELFSLLKNYHDLLYTNESYENNDEIQKVYTLHILNHLFYSRSRILTNNKVFEKKTLSDNVIHDDPILRDQGFTRPKILILLPFRHSALKLGKSIVNILGDSYNIVHLDRFIKEFGDEDGVDATLRPVASDQNKPSDYFHTFHGNTDDSFRVGLKLTKKSIKFFADFYDSDIIIASPLGLKTIISPDEHQAASSLDSEQLPANGDRDFLSSIEIMILDQADVFLMQNWEHILDIMQYINVMPAKPRKMDIARVRLCHLENWSKYYRQLIMFSSISVPLVHSFFQIHSFNYEGYITLKHRVDNPEAKQIVNKCKQRFLYYDSQNAKNACDERFNHFTRHVLPQFTGIGNRCSDGPKEPLDHTLILVSSYFDFVRLRNYFRREKLSFTQICEYTEDNKVAKARQLFYFGARQFLLYTERCHFYHRYKIKGIRNIIFYEPPVFPKFYSELIRMLVPELQGRKFDAASAQFSSTTLFSNHDTLQLGAIIGYSSAVKLIQNKSSIT